jgi:hypothetical protein
MSTLDVLLERKVVILFLDFDGVLHPEPSTTAQHFMCLPRLENVLRDHPTVEIVISSTWRETRTISELRLLFSEDISMRIIGVTPSWKDHQDLLDVIGYQRQTEIEAWLRASEEPWRQWVAIDDKPWLFKPFLPNLIRTDSEIGFDEDADTRLREFFDRNSR